ncbi:MAG: hypothetical protein ACAI35_01900 [Candidatus Methylacidiphilales bacterium]|nr:hypothetical protein [Candidatus Methylacidiphilales bacterium]
MNLPPISLLLEHAFDLKTPYSKEEALSVIQHHLQSEFQGIVSSKGLHSILAPKG